ncbi:hypothetical protein H0A71_21525 [Alcaligenaceae bacterium]|nr:hypothetical protein [Alcaligenaceae bacterium]
MLDAGVGHKGGKFQVIRLTMKKRMRATLDAIRTELMRRRHQPVPVVGKWLRTVVRGYFAYYGKHPLKAVLTDRPK